MRHFFDATGNLIPIQDLGEEETACLSSLEVLIKNAKDDGHTAEVHKFKLWDKTRALEALALRAGHGASRSERLGQALRAKRTVSRF
jgi:hypothetical protein